MSNTVQINDQNTTVTPSSAPVNLIIADPARANISVVEDSANTVTVNIQNVVAAPEIAEYNLLVSSQEKASLDVFEQVTTVVTVNSPGPAGPPGPQGPPGGLPDLAGYVTTSSFYAFTSSYTTASFQGNLAGTASWALTALTASYVQSSVSLPSPLIFAGYVTASVSTTPSSMFLLTSASVPYFSITSSKGETSFYSDLFIINNFTTKQPVLTVTESIVQFATHSQDPTGTISAGSIWFTATTMYVGLE